LRIDLVANQSRGSAAKGPAWSVMAVFDDQVTADL
jgi:hypothetical protein